MIKEFAISVKNISYSYDNVSEAIDDVSLDIEKGKYVSVIGHNGSGKSTFAKLISGLLEVKIGTINVFGLPLDDKNIDQIRQHMGIVFQNPDNQFIGASVRDDIAFGLENRNIDPALMDGIINKYAEEVGMVEFLDKEPTLLSGGQKQRVAIAGVLAMNPDIIILDEATAMLDPRGRREIGQIVDRMKKNNPLLTIITITHDIEETLTSDEIIVFNQGKVFLKGSPKEVYEKGEELREIKLDLPLIHKLKNIAQQHGIKITASDIDGVAEQLWP